MSSTNHCRLKICLLVIVSLFASSIHADNLQSSTTLATTTTKQQPEHDQIPSSSDENSSNNGDVDGSSSNKFETTVQSPDGHQLLQQQQQHQHQHHHQQQQQQQQHHQPQSPQQPQSQERPLHLLLQSSSEQDVSSQSAQGQFMPLSDKEVGSGHVTMIGYTTPIVKFGDPIPLEEFLKQAQKQRDEASAAAGSNVLPPSSSSDQHFAQIIARMAENSPNMQEARSASVDTPLRLLLANQQQQQQPQHQQHQQQTNLQQAQANEASSRPQLIQIQAADVNSNEIEKFGRQISFDQGELFPGTQTLDLQREQKLSPLLLQQQPQLQLQPQQSRPQFAAPMEKPRPFLVMKPGFPKQNQQKLLQHIQIQHQIPQQQLSQQQAKLSQLIPQQPQLQQPEDRFKLIPSQLVLPAQVTNELVDNPANPFAGFTPIASLPPANEQTSSQLLSSRQPLGSLGKLDHFQPQSRSRIHVGPNPPPFGSHFFGSQTPFGSGQAHSSFLRTAKLSDQLTAAAPSSAAQQASSVDTKAQLQDQIKHVLTTSPNLSEDSRVKHRDAIFKAVQSLVDTTASEHLDSGAIRVDGSQLTSSHNPSVPTGHSMIRDDRLSGFPQFHPKSMLFRMPTTSNVNSPTVSSSLLNNGERKPFMQAPVAHAPGLNFLPRLPTLLPGLHQQNAVSQGVLNSLHQQPQQQLLPAQHHQQPHPSLLLQPQPQLISTVSGHAPPNQQQLQADQKIQSQIQSFLQQNDPLRQQLAAQLHLSNPNPNHHHLQQQQQQQLQQQHQLPPQFFTTLVQQSGSEASPTASLFPGAPSRFILENPHQTLLAPQQHQTGGKIRLGPGLLLNAEEDNGGSMANHFGTMSEQGSHHHQKRADHHAAHHHHHHHLHQVNQNNEKQSEPQPEQSRQSSSPLTPYQPDESSFLAHAPKPTTTMREYSEWWKERALAAEAAEAAANAMSLIPPVA